MMANYSTNLDTTLAELLPQHINADADAVDGADLLIHGLDVDSRHIESGDLFFAYPGAVSDGRDFISQAIDSGAAAIFYEEKNIDKNILKEQSTVSMFAIPELSLKIGAIAAQYFDHPSQKLCGIGVTGTNGKTTCSYFLAQLLNNLQLDGSQCKAGLVGTLGLGFPSSVSFAENEFIKTKNTTPGAVVLQSALFDFVKKNATHFVMEVSSHGLDQGRVNGVEFNTALFTNLTQDHLDYHGSMEAYGETKARLFYFDSLENAVINIDDSFGSVLKKDLELSSNLKDLNIVSFGLKNKDADVRFINLKQDENGFSACLLSPWGEANVFVPIFGEFNISNVLAVITTLCVSGFNLNKVLEQLKFLNTLAGRMEKVSIANEAGLDEADIDVFVDYAHTPDALAQVLKGLREISTAKIWCVFGCGGDRDKGKRAQMAEVVQSLADYCVVTSDNPRSEAPENIIADITALLPADSAITFIDRKEAIQWAVCSAEKNDVVLIAGKGAEDYQQFKNIKIPFSDVDEAKKALLCRVSAKGGLR